MEKMRIPFNKPFLTGKETKYIEDAVNSGKISGNGVYTKKCQKYFEEKWGFSKTLLTTSCTDALEMAALLCDIGPGDEVIIPSYTFVSTANPFLLRGANIVFADSSSSCPNIDPESISKLITDRTKVVVVVHYAGVSCDMDKIVEICKKHNLYLVEDAAQAIDSYYNGKPLGSFGDLATFSFHETKNIISGEGGLLVINNEKLHARSEILWEKGTNRSAFFKGEVDKYGWVDLGSSFLPSEIVAAFLYAQLENLELIQSKRIELWEYYYESLKKYDGLHFSLPSVPYFASNNAHMFYIVWKDRSVRDQYLGFMKSKGILPVFHYLSLHKSPYFEGKYSGSDLPNADFYTETLTRLPFYYELTTEEQDDVIEKTIEFIENLKK